MVIDVRVHDIVRLDPAIARTWPDVEAWVCESVLRAPWAVVRRERTRRIPIGIRGRSRGERYAAFVSRDDVACVATPEALVGCVVDDSRLGKTFVDLDDSARRVGVRVSPIGSFGFELASGVRTTTASSDLDVLVRAERLDFERLVAFGRIVDEVAASNGVRIDVELAFALGAVALHEVLARNPTVLFKTVSGPQLLPCPV